ncbi:hypothetical protein DNTS_027221 [Danionella cerebrum]|uniref:Coiled-coil domain-containing protein 24 n=1 Tax=Danionella cerebrum TaxID=2873325 RepID=A0A553REM1_9TELE|nr:hypothetical protein DNTS_027221 [Danionella translucida]
MDNFQWKRSVWNLVKENVPCSELPEIKSCAWRDSGRYLHRIIFRDHSSRPEAPVFPLADPPAVKELLKAEIQLLLLSLREKAAGQGRDADDLFARYRPSVVTYALGRRSNPHRPGSPDSFWEKEPPSRPPSTLSATGSRAASRLSSHSNFEEEIKVLRHKLNITHIDEVENIEKKRVGAETEAESPEPTLAELREERRLIQRDLSVRCSVGCSYNTSPTSRNRWIQERETQDISFSTKDSGRSKEVQPLNPSPTQVRSDWVLTLSSEAQSNESEEKALKFRDTQQKAPAENPLKHRGNSARASAFRLLPAASGALKHFLVQVEESGCSGSQHLQPAPPAGLRTPNMAGSRRWSTQSLQMSQNACSHPLDQVLHCSRKQLDVVAVKNQS